MKIVSACLAGVSCRWDGKYKTNELIVKLISEGKAIPVCPEQLGGLTTPRMPAEQRGNKVFTKDGREVTKNFVKGAEEGFKIAKLCNCKEAILKAKSPSCGCGKIYDGTFTGNIISGDGVFTKLLKQNGIKVTTEDYI
ncbi:MAG: DUF523 domain-containing protein [Candidatus Marsarchaeota archaeon]|nr:DUF523 domain-containing protein [Candidatus Marsarchaeota archaeon]